MQITKEMTMNQVTDAFPATLKVLDSLGFDTCCEGAEALGEMAVKHNIPFDKVVAALEPLTKGA